MALLRLEPVTNGFKGTVISTTGGWKFGTYKILRWMLVFYFKKYDIIYKFNNTESDNWIIK